MSIQKINPDDIETFTLTTNPTRTFVSTSLGGILTGSLNVFARRSPFEKDIKSLTIYTGSFFDNNLDVIRNNIIVASGTNKYNSLRTYLSNINANAISFRKQQTVQILRFEPGVNFSSNSIRKTVIINNLMPYYRVIYPEAHFAFTNYNSLNFMTGSGLPDNAALIYADPSARKLYSLTGSFSFDFWINPRYTSDYEGQDFKAGTILQRSSSYVLSLMTGSSRDINGLPDKFKLCLQLSHSAEIPPSLASAGVFPRDLIFYSSDNALKRNAWNHITVRWGTSNYNLGSGSFFVNNIEAGTFVIPSASLPETKTSNCLFVGNYFQGPNVSYFFTTDVSQRDGLDELVTDTGEVPISGSFSHPLNAEVHELKIYNKYLNKDEVSFLNSYGPLSGSDLLSRNLLFYLPPFYTSESPFRRYYGNHGGIITTPFYEKSGSTSAPINVDVSFGCGGHYINLENYVKDFATGKFARLFNLTASVIQGTTNIPQSFNNFLYSSGSNIKRNMLIMPCDNGNFIPNFTFMIPTRADEVVSTDWNDGDSLYIPTNTSQSFATPWKVNPNQFINDFGNKSPGFVSLRNLIPMEWFQTPAQESSGNIERTLNGASPESLGDLPSSHERYTVLQRTGDNSCNQVIFWDISNLYYGMSIEPGTLVLKDNSFTGSNGKMTVTIKDDGEGNLFRADHISGSYPDWSSVGNVFYNEGIVLLKHPSLFFMGKNQFQIDFQGMQNTHILTFNLFKRSQTNTSSSNPNYLPVSASDYANDTDKKFVYLTSLNLHDDNLNIIAKTAFAQPVVARSSDRFLLKPKIDF